MLAAGLIFLVLNLAVLAPLSTGGVQDAVDEKFETYTKDTACANDDCTEAKADWAVSTSQREYSAWTITNVDDILATGADPTYTEIDPFTYDITKTNTLTGYDKTNGTMTYTQVKSHQCAAESVMPCDTPVTQINIGFQPQVIGATGLAINGIMDLTKVAFSAGMMGNDLENMQAGTATAATISAQMAVASAVLQDAPYNLTAETADAMAPAAVFSGFDAYFAAINGSQMNNMTGNNETYTYSQAMSGQLADFTGMPPMAMTSAMMPTGESAALTGGLGVLLLAGHCSAYATADYAGIMADAANGFANVGTMQRATIWGYMAMADATTPDFNATIARDYAVCFGVGALGFLANGGGDATWYADTTGDSVDASARFANMGITIDNMVAMNLLFAGQGTDTPTGLLASNADQTAFGLATFMQMDAVSAMTAFGLDATQYGAIMMWAGAWLTDVSSLPMVLKGGSGDMTASLFVNTTFGSADPINGGYLTNSLNLGGAWGTLISAESSAVDLTAAQSGNLLYGPLGLTTQAGATLFLFG